MSASVPLPDPSAAAASPVQGGYWFAFARTHARGLPLVVWMFLAHLFLVTSYADEEWLAIGALRLRSITGLAVVGLILLEALLRFLVPSGRRRGQWGIDMPGLLAAPASGWLYLFLIAGCLSWVWAYAPGLAGPAQIEHARQVLLFVVGTLLLTTRRRVLLAILVVCAGYGLYLVRSFQEYLSGKYDFTMGVSRMLGAGTSYEDPNSFAATVVFGMVLVTWAAIHTRSVLLRLCGIAYFLLGTVCVVYAHSRSGLVLLLLTVPWIFFALPRTRTRLVLLAAVVLLGVALVGVQTEAAMERFAGIFSSRTYEQDASTRGRIEGYRVSWEIFRRNPVFGVGPENWATYRTRHIDGDKHEPHTLGGQLIATRGLAGVVTFLGFLLATVAFALRTRRERKGREDPWDRAVAGLAGVVLMTLALLFVSGLAAHNLDRPQWYLVPALLAAAALHGTRREAT